MTTQLLSRPQTIINRKRSDHHDNILTAAKGGGITFVGQLFSFFISICFSILIARFLGSQDYGLYRLAITVCAVTVSFCFLGLNRGITRYIPIARSEENIAWLWGIVQIGVGIPLLLGLLLFLIILFAAEPISTNLLNKPELAPILRLASLSIPVIVLSNTLFSIAQGFKQIKFEVYSYHFALNIVKVILSLILLMLGSGVMGVMIAYNAAFVVCLGAMAYFVYRLFPFKLSLKTAQRRTGEMLRYSIPLYFSSLLRQFGGKLETLVLGVFGVLADVGVFAVLLNISTIGQMGLVSLQRISAPIISELCDQQSYRELEKYCQTVAKWAFTFNLPIFLTIIIFPENILQIFGKEFTVGTTGLIILASGYLFGTSVGSTSTIIDMAGYSKVTFYNSVFYLIITILLNILLIPRWYLLGAALANSLSLIMINILRLVEIYILVHGILPFNWSFLKPISASFLAAALAWGLRQFILSDQPLLQFVIIVVIMWVAYILIILALKLSHEDRLIVKKVRNWVTFKRDRINTD